MRSISTEIETIVRIFLRKKSYSIKSNLSTKNSTMLRRRILMNTCISTKRRTWANKNEISSTKKMTMMKMIAKKINMKRKMKIGIRNLTGI